MVILCRHRVLDARMIERQPLSTPAWYRLKFAHCATACC